MSLIRFAYAMFLGASLGSQRARQRPRLSSSSPRL